MRVSKRILFAEMSLVAVFVAIGLLLPRPARAVPPSVPVTPVTIDGVVKNSDGSSAVGRVMVAWCGDISHFGGSDVSDANGHFIMHTNSEDCPLGSDLALVAYNKDDASLVDGVGHATVHTQTTVNVKIGEFNNIPVPEYGWLGAAASVAAGGGAIALVRRRF